MAGQSPYETALALGGARPAYVTNDEDASRVIAYNTYSDVYRNVPEAFTAVLRTDEGDEISRRLVPGARTIVEATNRYLAKGPTITPSSEVTLPDGTSQAVDVAAAEQVMGMWGNFVKREEFWTKFSALKRWMLIRGDGILHVYADDKKAQGTRVSITELDPATYFRIPDPLDSLRTVGVYLVTLIPNDANDGVVAQRQEYKFTEAGRIWTQLTFWEEDGWDDRFPLSEADLKPLDPPQRFAGMPLVTGFELDSRITTIPVYLYRNNREGNQPYGTSELQGIETLLAGMIQTATDEDLTIVLTGIGVYVTTSGKPRDTQGNEIDWVISPASVMELESHEDRFERVEGVSSVEPMQDHFTLLESQALRTSGTADIAVGRVDVQVAESGIALSLQMAPTLAKNEEKELELKSVTEHLLYDLLNMWFLVYEGLDPKGTALNLTFDNPLPDDRAAILKEIIEMLTNKIISIEFAGQLIKERLGYSIPDDMLAAMVAEQGQMLDAVGARADAEAGGGGAVV